MGIWRRSTLSKSTSVAPAGPSLRQLEAELRFVAKHDSPERPSVPVLYRVDCHAAGREHREVELDAESLRVH